MSNVIKTEFGDFTAEDIKALLQTEAGKKARASVSSERKAERERKALEAKERAENALKNVALLASLGNIEIPETVLIKKVGVTNKTDTYKDVYINFRLEDETPHTMSVPVSGEVDTDASVKKFEDAILNAKLHLIRLVAKLG